MERQNFTTYLQSAKHNAEHCFVAFFLRIFHIHLLAFAFHIHLSIIVSDASSFFCAHIFSGTICSLLQNRLFDVVQRCFVSVSIFRFCCASALSRTFSFSIQRVTIVFTPCAFVCFSNFNFGELNYSQLLSYSHLIVAIFFFFSNNPWRKTISNPPEILFARWILSLANEILSSLRQSFSTHENGKFDELQTYSTIALNFQFFQHAQAPITLNSIAFNALNDLWIICRKLLIVLWGVKTLIVVKCVVNIHVDVNIFGKQRSCSAISRKLKLNFAVFFAISSSKISVENIIIIFKNDIWHFSSFFLSYSVWSQNGSWTVNMNTEHTNTEQPDTIAINIKNHIYTYSKTKIIFNSNWQFAAKKYHLVFLDFSEGFQHTSESHDSVDANETELVFLRGLLDSPAQLIKVIHNCFYKITIISKVSVYMQKFRVHVIALRQNGLEFARFLNK